MQLLCWHNKFGHAACCCTTLSMRQSVNNVMIKLPYHSRMHSRYSHLSLPLLITVHLYPSKACRCVKNRTPVTKVGYPTVVFTSDLMISPKWKQSDYNSISRGKSRLLIFIDSLRDSSVAIITYGECTSLAVNALS